jgi:hypothetical protein
MEARLRYIDVDWRAGYGNGPVLALGVTGADGVPRTEDLTWRYAPLSGGGTLYHAAYGDLVKMLVHNPSDQHGFGGAPFDLTIADGSARRVYGPWSGRSSVLNSAVPEADHVTEAEWSGHLVMVRVSAVLRLSGGSPFAGFGLARIDGADVGPYYEACRPDGTLKRLPPGGPGHTRIRRIV